MLRASSTCRPVDPASWAFSSANLNLSSLPLAMASANAFAAAPPRSRCSPALTLAASTPAPL
eukprot:CAMPEP_0183477288 /NCGR_PEP_ID=MMETSP0370-20130417/167985_1 /TAXON_ID=268820 /ORGANISM="Peridinium aciculiferum, Strain PAER-2" /LENGTH=61 /DNA_ID=CAMNT_0025670181 /DNA_START=17 /DNA_END=198 /DNA_ORIENTATION=-